ncbi:hypothetical protein Jiend_05200 [Micromonospora endophytica]|nr:hypothetical protein Jiend_05200 [Micromonospora endophytica]
MLSSPDPAMSHTSPGVPSLLFSQTIGFAVGSHESLSNITRGAPSATDPPLTTTAAEQAAKIRHSRFFSPPPMIHHSRRRPSHDQALSAQLTESDGSDALPHPAPPNGSYR